MLAQTNLQLYGQLTSLGWSAGDLSRARAAYDLARELFSDCYRPTHKPFVCHLIGVASAAAYWSGGPSFVLAGLLHSAYHFGQFGDGERGASPRRRRHLRSVLGDDAEAKVYSYFAADQRPASEPVAIDAAWLRLADLLDELCDAGPLYAPRKEASLRLADSAFRQSILDEARRVVGPTAVRSFGEAFAACDAAHVDPALATLDRAYHRQPSGCESLKRTRLHRSLLRVAGKLSGRNAA